MHMMMRMPVVFSKILLRFVRISYNGLFAASSAKARWHVAGSATIPVIYLIILLEEETEVPAAKRMRTVEGLQLSPKVGKT
jgi:hypothetical protein